MADVDFDDFDAGYGAPMARQVRLSRIITLAGAGASVALVIGVGIWGYDIAVRDVQGVPVIRAMEGPMRITPENPGGEVADHQGLSVNAVAALGIAAPPPERLLLAPRPIELTEEDQPGLSGDALVADTAVQAPLMAGQVAPAPALAAPAPLVMTGGAMAVSAPPPVAAAAPATAPDPQQDAVEMALAEALSDGMGEAEDMTELAALEPAAVPAATETARPRARPGDALAPAAIPAAAPAAEMDPATLAQGTRLVQLGAFDTPEDARAEWARLLNANPDLLMGKALVVQAANSGGRAFFRLRAAGFASEDQARDLCSALLERDATCIPVLHR